MLDVIKIIKNSDYHNYLVFKMLEGNCVACSGPCFAFREEIHIFDMNGNYSIRAVLQRYVVLMLLAVEIKILTFDFRIDVKLDICITILWIN